MSPPTPRLSPPEEGSPELELLVYVEDCSTSDEPLSLEVVRGFLCRVSKPLDWPLRDELDMPIIHHVIMNDATAPEDAEAILLALLEYDANPSAVDCDGDNAIQTLMALAEDAERDSCALEPEVKILHLTEAKVLANYHSSKPGWGEDDALAVVSWLARYMPDCAEAVPVRAALESRLGRDAVVAAWSSEELFDYLEACAYTDKAGLSPSKVQAILAKGASPRHSRNGATCFLLCVLNPYSKFEDLVEVFDAMLRVDPEVVTVRDGFGLTALHWASNFRDLAQQHNLKVPNPSALLALMPSIAARVAPTADGCESCFKVSPDGTNGRPKAKYVPTMPPPPRFIEGDRVCCRVEAPGNTCEWEEGVVIGLWYREKCWPKHYPGAPYEVRLDLGSRVYALVDDDRIIRRFLNFRPGARGVASPAPAAPTGGAANEAGDDKGKGPRFVRRQKDDGTWEMYDTVSGKARAVKAPGSDDDSD